MASNNNNGHLANLQLKPNKNFRRNCMLFIALSFTILAKFMFI